jgi:hypothetical protein
VSHHLTDSSQQFVSAALSTAKFVVKFYDEQHDWLTVQQFLTHHQPLRRRCRPDARSGAFS